MSGGVRRAPYLARLALKAEAADLVPPRPRTKPADVRRDDLLRAGEALFVERGFAATSIDDIAAAADIAKGTFYLSFASKEELLAALRERFADSHRARIAAEIARRPAADWSGKLRAFVAGSVTFYLGEVKLHDALFHAADLHPRRHTSRSDNRVAEALAELLAAGDTAGAWRVADPALTAVLLFNALHGAVDHAIAHGEDGDSARLIRALQEFCLRAVGEAAAPIRRRSNSSALPSR